ncbi:MAG: AarF/ABC1/UbiB kinase family protein [Acidimicrobiaceae bacterium]|nr:AarF/ABC1/UbiB kinase family protein [Acidimicrobiaceae bacterium]
MEQRQTFNERSVTLPGDSTVGSFSLTPPWLVDLDKLEWLGQTPNLRVRTHEELPRLIRKRRIPPLRRFLWTGLILGNAIGRWWLIDRRKGTTVSRAGLSHRLRDAFEVLGPTYIKLGQILSSGNGIFPDELVNEFKSLRDQVKPESFDKVRTTVESDLGRELEEIFSEFDSTPLAAASIAQVHQARLRSGEEVVVKVQRPRVAELVRRDLAAMSWIAPILVGRIPIAALANPPALVELFAETIIEELDFRLEAANMIDISTILAKTDQRALVVPRPHPRYVTRRVLIMEKLSGFNWDDISGMVDAGIDTAQVVRAGMVAFMEGAMVHGVFHGDLHGGNLLVLSTGEVGLLDYGITGRLTEKKRLAFLRLLIGGTINDVRLQVAALRDMGALPEDTDLEAVVSELGLDGPPIDPTSLSPDELISEIRNLTKALLGFGARMPKELMLFVKNMIFLDSSMVSLAPDLDLFAEITFLATYFTSKYGDQISKDVGVDLASTPIDLIGVKGSLGIPSDVETLTYKELVERRELIRKRMESNQAGRRVDPKDRWTKKFSTRLLSQVKDLTKRR